MSDVSSNPSDKTPVNPKPKMWSPVTAFAFVLVSFVVLPVVAGVMVSYIPTLLGWDSIRADEWLLNSPVSTFLYVLLSETLTLTMLAWFIAYRKASFKEIMALKRFTVRDIGYGLGGTVVYFLLFAVTITIVQELLPVNTSQEQALGFEKDVAGAGLVLAFISLVVLPPLVEELVFRGFFYGTLRSNNISFLWSTIVTSTIFGALHLFGAADGQLLWIAFIDTFVLSLVLCYVREKSGSIWSSVVIHALKNGFVFVNLFIITAR